MTRLAGQLDFTAPFSLPTNNHFSSQLVYRGIEHINIKSKSSSSVSLSRRVYRGFVYFKYDDHLTLNHRLNTKTSIKIYRGVYH